MMKSRTLTALVGAALLTACSTGDDGESTPPAAPDDAVSTTLSPPAGKSMDPDEADQFLEDIQRPDQDHELTDQTWRETSTGWSDYEVASETELRFFTTMGTPRCFGLRYDLEETEEEVAVAIITGSLEEETRECTAEAVFAAVRVELEDPLGEREIVELDAPELNE